MRPDLPRSELICGRPKKSITEMKLSTYSPNINNWIMIECCLKNFYSWCNFYSRIIIICHTFCKWITLSCVWNSSGWVLRVLSIREHISSLFMKLALLQRLSLVHCSEQDVNEPDVLSEKGVSSKRIDLFTISKTAWNDSWAPVLLNWRVIKIAMASICWQV